MKKYWLFFFCFFLMSCFENEPKKQSRPAMDKEVFVKILTDIHITEVTKGHQQIEQKDLLRKDMGELYGHILAFHGGTEADFLQTFQYYREYPEEMIKVYDEVMEKLTTLEVEGNEKESGQ